MTTGNNVENENVVLTPWGLRPLRHYLRPAAGLFLLTVLLYLRSLSLDFVLWDDPDYVLRNKLVQSGFSLRSIMHAWTTFEFANWHPMTWMSLMLDHQIYGLRPAGFHLTNSLLHAANSVLLFLWLISFGERTGRLSCGQAWFVACVFAVHPVHVESVAWITERKDVLATFFGLLSFISYDRWKITDHPRWWRWCIVWFSLSLCAKPLFVTLPCVLLLLDCWPTVAISSSNDDSLSPRPRTDSPNFRGVTFKRLVEKWPLFILTFCSCVITFWAQYHGGAVSSLEKVSLGTRVVNALVNYWSYLRLFFWPFELCAFYPFTSAHVSEAITLYAVGTLVLISVVAILLWRKLPGVLIGWLFYLGTLVPMIGLIQVGNQSIADRYLYVPLIGLTIAIAIASNSLFIVARAQINTKRFATCIVLLLISRLTWHQIGTWKNTESMSRQCLKVIPDNWNGHLLLATAHWAANRDADAIDEYSKALAINPNAKTARTNLAVILCSQGRVDEGMRHFRIGLELEPNYGKLRLNYGVAIARSGNLEEALLQYEMAMRDSRMANSPEFYHNYGVALSLTNRFDEAIPILERAVELAPDRSQVRLHLAKSLLNCNSPTSEQIRRAQELAEIIALESDLSEAHLILAEANLMLGNASAGEEYCQAAMEAAKREKRDDLVKRGQELISRVEQSFR